MDSQLFPKTDMLRPRPNYNREIAQKDPKVAPCCNNAQQNLQNKTMYTESIAISITRMNQMTKAKTLKHIKKEIIIQNCEGAEKDG